MEWLCNLIFGSGVAHSILVVAIVIAIGVILGKFKVFGEDDVGHGLSHHTGLGKDHCPSPDFLD